MSTSALVRPSPRHRAADLLTAYLPGSFYYSSAGGALLADGVHAVVDGPREVEAALAAAAAVGVREPLVVGAIGFGPESPASLVVPAVVRRAGPPAALDPAAVDPAALDPAPAEGDWTVRERPAAADYEFGVRRALDLIAESDLRKVVLGRGLELTAGSPVRVPALLHRLVRANPGAHAFAVDVTAPGDPAPRTLVGASPELLVSRHGDRVVANPLAGSLPRVPEGRGAEAENRRRIAALLASDKDRREHALVAGQVGEVLGRFCTDLVVPAAPEVIGTPTMWHLSSRITGRLVDLDMSSLALAAALHPTPAVCGVPLDPARSAIAALEPDDRGYFTGLVGWTGQSGDGEWVITIRSAEVSGDTVRLFAGAGIVEGSEPAAELAETGAKFRTMLRALGVDE